MEQLKSRERSRKLHVHILNGRIASQLMRCARGNAYGMSLLGTVIQQRTSSYILLMHYGRGSQSGESMKHNQDVEGLFYFFVTMLEITTYHYQSCYTVFMTELLLLSY